MNAILGTLVLSLAAPPILTVDAAKVDRGEVRGGPILKQTFTVSNSSTDRIALTGLESGCGCLRRSVSKNELKPGESAEVSMDVNTLTQPDGPQTWLLKLRYRPALAAKDQADQVLELRLTATLVREVSVTPPMISVSTDSATTATITLTDKRKEPLTVRKVVSSSPRLVPKFSGSGGRFTIELAIAAELSAGTHDETIVVHTDDPHYAELQIPARIVKRAKNEVNAYPESLDLEGNRGIIQFRRSDGKPVRIDSAACETAGVTVTASTGTGPVATVKVTTGNRKGTAEVKVKFAEPAGAERTIPIRWGD